MLNAKPSSCKFNAFWSFVDLEKIEDWKEAFNGQNEKLFNEILYTHGVDLEYGWEIEVVLHRPRTSNMVDYGPILRYKERTDKEFEQYRTVEDICRDSTSSFVRYGMRNSLNAGATINDAIEDHLSTRAKLKELREKAKKEKK